MWRRPGLVSSAELFLSKARTDGSFGSVVNINQEEEKYPPVTRFPGTSVESADGRNVFIRCILHESASIRRLPQHAHARRAAKT